LTALDDGHWQKRGDGTQAYFFELEALKAIWEEAGCTTEAINVREDMLENARQGLSVQRRFIHATFRRR